jgi:hypothetical protein
MKNQIKIHLQFYFRVCREIETNEKSKSEIDVESSPVAGLPVGEGGD